MMTPNDRDRSAILLKRLHGALETILALQATVAGFGSAVTTEERLRYDRELREVQRKTYTLASTLRREVALSKRSDN